MCAAKAKAAREAEKEQEVQEEQDLYEFEIDRYRASLKRDRAQALKRYGLTLFHSLDNREKIELLKEFGFTLDQPEDEYNEGVVAFEAGDYKRARDLFAKAYKAKEDLACTLFNLALTYEKLENSEKAIETWKAFLDHPKAGGREKAEVEKHLKELIK